MMRSFCLGIECLLYYWAFSPYGLCEVDYLPKALPLGYVLLGFQPVWVVWG